MIDKQKASIINQKKPALVRRLRAASFVPPFVVALKGSGAFDENTVQK